jgi:hypothetical protein
MYIHIHFLSCFRISWTGPGLAFSFSFGMGGGLIGRSILIPENTALADGNKEKEKLEISGAAIGDFKLCNS